MNSKKSTIKPKKIYLIDKKKQKSGFISVLKGDHDDIYETFYNNLMGIPDGKPVDIIIATQGGSAIWCSKICYVLKNREGKSRVFVKSHAHSAGTVIALSASELYITYDTTFSAIDAQTFPLNDLFQTSLQLLPKLFDDPRSALVNINKERAKYFRDIVEKCLSDSHNKELVMRYMHDDVSIHEQLFFKERMNEFGIKYNIWDGNDKKLPEYSEKKF